jgi:hypothetical protein
VGAQKGAYNSHEQCPHTISSINFCWNSSPKSPHGFGRAARMSTTRHWTFKPRDSHSPPFNEPKLQIFPLLLNCAAVSWFSWRRLLTHNPFGWHRRRLIFERLWNHVSNLFLECGFYVLEGPRLIWHILMDTSLWVSGFVDASSTYLWVCRRMNKFESLRFEITVFRQCAFSVLTKFLVLKA